jgi:hypothetical protein
MEFSSDKGSLFGLGTVDCGQISRRRPVLLANVRYMTESKPSLDVSWWSTCDGLIYSTCISSVEILAIMLKRFKVALHAKQSIALPP